MLSYRHSFHAGNHADVLKHTVLCLLLDHLKRKEKPFWFMDTHAGCGRYDLHSKEMAKTGEYQGGIARLWDKVTPPAIQPYLDTIRQLNSDGHLRLYPGSPLIALRLCREQDRLQLCELHPADFQRLAASAGMDKRVRITQEDGFKKLKASLPPTQRRGLVLIDPSYELATDYQTLFAALKDSLIRWPTGTFAIWYPVIFREQVTCLENTLKQLQPPKTLQMELCVTGDNSRLGMTGSGMLVINPPWQLELQMQDVLPYLQETLALDDNANHRLRWLIPEKSGDSVKSPTK